MKIISVVDNDDYRVEKLKTYMINNLGSLSTKLPNCFKCNYKMIYHKKLKPRMCYEILCNSCNNRMYLGSFINCFSSEISYMVIDHEALFNS